jgi:hypothetical protein
MSFGYIGPEPTNNNTENNGVFSIDELNDLKDNAKLSSEAFDVDFVIVGGGAAAGTQGGGGAGGVCTSVANQGGGGTLDDALRLSVGVDYQVVIGAGGGINDRQGNPTVFHTISAMPGGRGYVSDASSDGASAGGGGIAFDYANRGFAINKYMSETDRFKVYGSKSAQGYDGNQPSYESYNTAGGGGGAGVQGAGSKINGSNGVINNIQSVTNAALSGAGEVSGSNVYFAGGGGAAQTGGGTNGGLGGAGNGFANSSNAGDPNTGGGGGGNWNGTSSAGGSGVVVLSYPDTYTITAGAGVTVSAEYDEGGGITSVAITAGSGNVSWSKA